MSLHICLVMRANYDALAVPVNLKNNMPQFIERTHFN